VKARTQVVVPNPLGLHARAAARFVQSASRYAASVRVTCGDQTVDGKSILGILLLAASRGSTLTIEADGVDAQMAAEGLRSLVASGFGEIG
jgi:phosphocarrier protein